LTSKVFTKLLGLFVLLLVFQTVVMEFVFRSFVSASLVSANPTGLPRARPSTGWHSRRSGPALSHWRLPCPWPGWVAVRVSGRIDRVVAFARRIADGDLSARLDEPGSDEFAAMEAALNRTAERLGHSFDEIESRRQELATMLDSMQEAVVAITPEGLVRWSNAVMRRIAGTPNPARPPACPLSARSRGSGLRPRRPRSP